MSVLLLFELRAFIYVCSTLLHQYKKKTKLISGFYVASVTEKKYLKLPAFESEIFCLSLGFFVGLTSWMGVGGWGNGTE